jgi:hypothetical protein
MMRGLEARLRVSVGAAFVLVGVGCSSATPGENGGNVVGVGGPPAGIAGAGGSGTTVIPPGMIPPAGAAGNGGAVGPGNGTAMPCEIQTVVTARCGTCHGATPIGGSPTSLLTLADFQKDYTAVTTTQLVGKSFKMYELAKIRINKEMGTTGMPQGTPLMDAEKTMLTSWLSSGAPAGTACSSTGGMAGTGSNGMAGTGSNGMAGAGGTGAPKPMGANNECLSNTTAFEPLVEREGETCYEFLTHGASSTTDTSKFDVPTGESYNQFYYAVPWPAGTVATRFGAKFDNLKVLHHWLGFASASAPQAAGAVVRNVSGTTLGENAELVGGWAVGGCNVEFPEDMGLKLPDTGKIMIQWHHYNSTGMQQPDGSIVQWCTVPATMRENIGGLTFLGTENFNGLIGMPPGRSDFGGTCTNDSGGPVTIVGFNPHMHLLGVHMKSVITRAAGGMETVFDEPFQFDQQVNYMMNPPVVMMPGDRITSTCTFDNTTDANVAFGQPTTSEMCYQFAFAYPYGALNSPGLSLIGATNICW